MTEDLNKNLSNMTMDSLSSDYSGKEDESTTSGVSLQTSQTNSRAGTECQKIAKRTKLIMAAFPWLAEFFKIIRRSLKVSDCFQKQLINYMDRYLSYLKPEAIQCATRPNKAFYLAQSIIEILVLFKNLNYEFEMSQEYLSRLHQILGNYVDLELKGSLRGKETVAEITTRIILTLEAHTKPADSINFMYVFLNMRRLQNGHRDILQLLFMRLLKPALNPYEFNDKKFLIYLIVFKLWRNIETCKLGKTKVSELAEKFMKPKRSPSCNKRISRYLPQNVLHDDTTSITYNILQNKFNVERLIKVLKTYNSDNDVSDTEDYDIVDLDNDEIMDLTNDDPVASIPQTTTTSTSTEMDKDIPIPFPPIQSIPLIKLESPKIVECIDLTEEPNNKLNWLSELAARARNAVIVPQAIIAPIRTKEINCMDIIEIDDDEQTIVNKDSLVINELSENSHVKDIDDTSNFSQSQPLTTATNEIAMLVDVHNSNTALPKRSDNLENEEICKSEDSSTKIEANNLVPDTDKINSKVIDVNENCDKIVNIELVSTVKNSDVNTESTLDVYKDTARDSNKLIDTDVSNIVLESSGIREKSSDKKSAAEFEQNVIINEVTSPKLSNEVLISFESNINESGIVNDVNLESEVSKDIVNTNNTDYSQFISQNIECSQDAIYDTQSFPIGENDCISFNEVVMSSETSDSEISNQEENLCSNLFLPINEIEISTNKKAGSIVDDDQLSTDEASTQSSTKTLCQGHETKINEKPTDKIVEDQNKTLVEKNKYNCEGDGILCTISSNELHNATKSLDSPNMCHTNENDIKDKHKIIAQQSIEKNVEDKTEISQNIIADVDNDKLIEKELGHVPYPQKSNLDELSSKENVVFSMSYKQKIPNEQFKTAVVDTNVVFSVGSKVNLKPCSDKKSLTKDILEDWSSKSDEEACLGTSSSIDLEDNDSEFDELEPFLARNTPNAYSEDFTQEGTQQKQRFDDNFKSCTTNSKRISFNGRELNNDVKNMAKTIEQNVSVVKNRKCASFVEPLMSSLRMRQPNESTILEKKTYINPIITKQNKNYPSQISVSKESIDSSHSTYPQKQISSNCYINSESPTLKAPDNKSTMSSVAGSSLMQSNNPDDYAEHNNVHTFQRQNNNNINYTNNNNAVFLTSQVESTKKIYVQGCKLDLDFLARYKNLFKSKVVISVTPDMNKYVQQYLENKRMMSQPKIEHTTINKYKLKEIMEILKYRGKHKAKKKRLTSDSSSLDSDSEGGFQPKVKFQNHVKQYYKLADPVTGTSDDESCETDIDVLKNAKEQNKNLKSIRERTKSVDISNITLNGANNINEINRKPKSRNKKRKIYTPRTRRRRNHKMDNYLTENEIKISDTGIKLKCKPFVSLFNLALVKNVDKYLNLEITDNYNCLHFSSNASNENPIVVGETEVNSGKIENNITKSDDIIEEQMDVDNEALHCEPGVLQNIDINIIQVEHANNLNNEVINISVENNKKEDVILTINGCLDKQDKESVIVNTTVSSEHNSCPMITENIILNELVNKEDILSEEGNNSKKLIVDNAVQELEEETLEENNFKNFNMEKSIVETNTLDIGNNESIIENDNIEQDYNAISISDIIEDCNYLNEKNKFVGTSNIEKEIIEDSVNTLFINNGESVIEMEKTNVDGTLQQSSVINLDKEQVVILEETKDFDHKECLLIKAVDNVIAEKVNEKKLMKESLDANKNNEKEGNNEKINGKYISSKSSSGDESDSSSKKLNEPLEVNIWHQSNINKYEELKKNSWYKQLHMRLRKRVTSEPASGNKRNADNDRLNQLLSKPNVKIHRASLCLDLPDNRMNTISPNLISSRRCSTENINSEPDNLNFSNMQPIRWNSDPEIFQFDFRNPNSVPMDIENNENTLKMIIPLGNTDTMKQIVINNNLSSLSTSSMIFSGDFCRDTTDIDSTNTIEQKINNRRNSLDNDKVKSTNKKLMMIQASRRNSYPKVNNNETQVKRESNRKKKICKLNIIKNDSERNIKPHNESYTELSAGANISDSTNISFSNQIITRRYSLDSKKHIDEKIALQQTIRRNSYPNCNNVELNESESDLMTNEDQFEDITESPEGTKSTVIDDQTPRVRVKKSLSKRFLDALSKKKVMNVIAKLIKKKFESGELDSEDLEIINSENIHSIYSVNINKNSNIVENANKDLKECETVNMKDSETLLPKIDELFYPQSTKKIVPEEIVFSKDKEDYVHGHVDQNDTSLSVDELLSQAVNNDVTNVTNYIEIQEDGFIHIDKSAIVQEGISQELTPELENVANDERENFAHIANSIDIIEIRNTIEIPNNEINQQEAIVFDGSVYNPTMFVTPNNNDYVSKVIENDNIDKEIIMNGVKNTFIYSNYNNQDSNTREILIETNSFEENNKITESNVSDKKNENEEKHVNGIITNNKSNNLIKESQSTLNQSEETPKVNNNVIRRDVSTQIIKGSNRKKARKRNIAKINNKNNLGECEDNSLFKKKRKATISTSLPNGTEITTITLTNDEQLINNQNSAIVKSQIECSNNNIHITPAIHAPTETDLQQIFKTNFQPNNFNVISSLISPSKESAKITSNNNGISSELISDSSNIKNVTQSVQNESILNNYTAYSNNIITNNHNVTQQQQICNGHGTSCKRAKVSKNVHFDLSTFKKAQEQMNNLINENNTKVNKNVKSILNNSYERQQVEPNMQEIPNIDLTVDNVIVKHSKTEAPSERKRHQASNLHQTVPQPPILQPIIQSQSVFNKATYSLNNILPNNTDTNIRLITNNECNETQTVQSHNENFLINAPAKFNNEIGNNYSNCYNNTNNSNNNTNNIQNIYNKSLTSTLRRVRTKSSYVQLPFVEDAPLPANRLYNYSNSNQTTTFIPNHYNINNTNNKNEINGNQNLCSPTLVALPQLSNTSSSALSDLFAPKRRGRPRGSKNKVRKNMDINLSQKDHQESHNIISNSNSIVLNNLNLSKVNSFLNGIPTSLALSPAIFNVQIQSPTTPFQSLPAYVNGLQEQEAALSKQVATSQAETINGKNRNDCQNVRINNLPDVSEQYVIDACMDTNDEIVYSAGDTDTICSEIVISDDAANILLNKSQEFLESDDEPLINLRSKRQRARATTAIDSSKIRTSIQAINSPSLSSTIISPDPYNTFLSSTQRLSESPPTLVVNQDGKGDKRTYSKANCEQKIFVPPEIDLFISQDNINHNLDHDEVDNDVSIVDTGNVEILTSHDPTRQQDIVEAADNYFHHTNINNNHHHTPMGDYAFIDSIENSYKVQEDIFVNR